MRVRRLIVGGAISVLLLTGFGGGVGAAPNPNASEVGHCSSFFGQLQLRDDISRNLAAQDFPPGAFYSQAAKNKGDENCT